MGPKNQARWSRSENWTIKAQRTISAECATNYTRTFKSPGMRRIRMERKVVRLFPKLIMAKKE